MFQIFCMVHLYIYSPIHSSFTLVVKISLALEEGGGGGVASSTQPRAPQGLSSLNKVLPLSLTHTHTQKDLLPTKSLNHKLLVVLYAGIYS